MSLVSQLQAGFTRVATEFNTLRTDLRNGYRIDKRVGSTTSTATPSINTDSYDMYMITALAVNITSVTMTGTPTEGQEIQVCITGTATRTLAWGSSFEASTVPLPTTTVGTARLDVKFMWNAVTSKWRCLAVA